MSEDFNREDDLQFFAQPYLTEPEYTDDELREMDILRQNTSCCVSSTTRMCGNLVNVRDWHGREELLNKVVIFVFFAHKN